MKAILPTLGFALTASCALAQGEKQADFLRDLPQLSPETVERAVHFQTDTLNKVFGVNVKYTGLIPQLIQSDNKLQLINPWAPAYYGDAMDNVSFSPTTGRAEGFFIFAIRF